MRTDPLTRVQRPVGQHAQNPSPRPLRQVLKLVAVVVAVVVVSASGVAAYAAFELGSTFSAHAVDLEGQGSAPPDVGAIAGGVNLFLAGTDVCEASFAPLFGGRCKGQDAVGERNDVNLLVHISASPRRVTVISIPRDLVIPTPSCRRPDGSTAPATAASMLNATYGYGGLSCVVKTVSQLTGLTIPYAAKITWGGVIQLTDVIGGVTVCVANGIDDPYTHLHLSPGDHTISGMTALQFLRTRHGVGDGGDLGRISNQQQYLSRLARKLMSQGTLSNPAVLLQLATAAVQDITPSKSLTDPLTLVQIALAVKSVPFDQIVFVQYPTMGDPANPNRVVPNEPAAHALWAALAANKRLVLTGGASQGNGVLVEKPKASPGPSSSAASSGSPSGSPHSSPSPSTSAPGVKLPSSIAGQTAAEQTCSNGNG